MIHVVRNERVVVQLTGIDELRFELWDGLLQSPIAADCC